MPKPLCQGNKAHCAHEPRDGRVIQVMVVMTVMAMVMAMAVAFIIMAVVRM